MQYEVGQVHPILTSIGDNMLGSWPATIIEVCEHGVVLEKFETSMWSRKFRTWDELKVDAEWDSKWQEDPRRPADVWRRALSKGDYQIFEIAAENAWLRKAENNWNWS
jgi:hypothetical protein